jgi:rhodanese-related sulfurtransferase
VRGSRLPKFLESRHSPNGAGILKFIIDNYALIFAALISGGLLLWTSFSRSGGGAVAPAEAVRQINREKGVLIDVCEPGEHAAGHGTGARNIPLGQLAQRLGELPKNKEQPVLVLCQSGARASRAAATLRQQGWSRASAVEGGLRAWREAGLPVEKS